MQSPFGGPPIYNAAAGGTAQPATTPSFSQPSLPVNTSPLTDQAPSSHIPLRIPIRLQLPQNPAPPPTQAPAFIKTPTRTPQGPSGGIHFQGAVRGIHGWNDPPNLIGVVTMVTAMTVIKQAAVVDPSQRRVVEDTDKRLEELLERLGTQSVAGPVMAQLTKVAQAINSRDVPGASAAAVQLSLLATAHSAESRWILGVKRLVELYAKFGGN
ncbi:hypothetical protein BC829DRAFT_491647 [Chytridium lagenaria]|nr:hypothetical protein BC829DRAFT_491647 [Chytridium lagenaria]